MNKLNLILFIALGLAIAVFFWALMKRKPSNPKRSQKARTQRSPQPSGSGKITAKALLNEVIALQKRNAQWGDILKALNPTEDRQTMEILYALRGPHMFTPHTALGVIESGCRSVQPTASAVEALKAALESMNKVVRYGD